MSPRLRWLGLVLVLLLVGFWPYHELLHHVPWGPDAAKWVDRGTLDDPGWTEWVFSRKHFIGYRPLTALTFVLNEVLTGYAPWGYRLTDLLLHLGVGAALYDVYQRLTGHRDGWGLLAVVLLFAHPATEEVVPFVARRSYLLQALLSLVSVSMALTAARRAITSPWWLGVAVTTGLAMLANEGAFVVFAWLPFAVLHAAQGPLRARSRQLLGLVPTALVAAAVLARRVAVLGSLTGGYGKHYFAFVKGQRVMWRDMAEPDHLDIFFACWTYALAPHGVTGASVPYLRMLAPITAAALLAGLLLPLWRRAEGTSRSLPIVLLLWMAGAVAIVVASGTWFWRQAYFLLPPLGIAFAWVAHHAWHEARARRWLYPSAVLPLLFLLPAAALSTGPTLLGMNDSAHGARIEYGNHVHTVRALTSELQGPGTVYLAVPGKAGAIHNVRIWSNRFGAERGLVFKVLARMDNTSRAGRGSMELVNGRRPKLVIDGKHLRWETTRIDGVRMTGTTLFLDRLHSADESRWVYVVEPDAPPVLQAITGPAPRRNKGTKRPKPRDR